MNVRVIELQEDGRPSVHPHEDLPEYLGHLKGSCLKVVDTLRRPEDAMSRLVVQAADHIVKRRQELLGFRRLLLGFNIRSVSILCRQFRFSRCLLGFCSSCDTTLPPVATVLLFVATSESDANLREQCRMSNGGCLTDRELIAIAAGEASDQQAAHLNNCSTCRQRLERLRNELSNVRMACAEDSEPEFETPPTADSHAWMGPLRGDGDSKAESEDGPPSRIDRYAIEGELGRGGFAVVYLAYDAELDRKVALKMPRADQFDSQRESGAVCAGGSQRRRDRSSRHRARP